MRVGFLTSLIFRSQSIEELKQVKPTNQQRDFEKGLFLPFCPPLIFYCLAPVVQFPCWLSRGIKIKEIKNKRFLGAVFCWRFSMQLYVPKLVFDKVRFRLQIFTVQNWTKGVPWFTTELYFFGQWLLSSYLAVKVVEAFLCNVLLICKLGQCWVQGVKLSLRY